VDTLPLKGNRTFSYLYKEPVKQALFFTSVSLRISQLLWNQLKSLLIKKSPPIKEGIFIYLEINPISSY